MRDREHQREYARAYYKKNQAHIYSLQKAYNAKWREKNYKRMRAYNIRTLYNLTTEKYNELFEEQKGCCAICGKHQNEFNKSLHVDHNHTTGEVRGLLCKKCNSLLGYVHDDILVLASAIKYLVKK